ncbi:MAG: 16S rRNA (uracil(1498)-N(3))-methyltransferase [Acidobacteriota bacterium]
MTRRRFYAPRIAFADDGKTITLSVDEARHARDVLRLGRDDEVFVFDGEGREYRCVIADIGSRSITLTVAEETEAAKPESPLNLTLAVALLKGEKFDLVVQKATELGVTTLVPLITTRADVRIRAPLDAARKVERWQRIALESAKQCGRARLTLVNKPTNLDEFFRAITDVHLGVMFTARDGGSVEVAFETKAEFKSVIAMVGSEGGWTDDEISQARKHEWQLVTLGGRTLRAETAAIVAATLLQHRCGDLV